MMRFPSLLIPVKFIRHQSGSLMILFGFVIISIVTSCSSFEQSSASYLPAELEEAVQQETVQFFTNSGFESLHLDKVTELTILDIRHPAMQSTSPSGLVVRELWCFTTRARGTVNGASQEITHQWFGLKEADDWVVIPRHVVAYPAFWDDACDQAERLDA